MKCHGHSSISAAISLTYKGASAAPCATCASALCKPWAQHVFIQECRTGRFSEDNNQPVLLVHLFGCSGQRRYGYVDVSACCAMLSVRLRCSNSCQQMSPTLEAMSPLQTMLKPAAETPSQRAGSIPTVVPAAASSAPCCTCPFMKRSVVVQELHGGLLSQWTGVLGQTTQHLLTGAVDAPWRQAAGISNIKASSPIQSETGQGISVQCYLSTARNSIPTCAYGWLKHRWAMIAAPFATASASSTW